MTVKQAVIFAFMLVFLVLTLTSAWMWAYFKMELETKKNALATMTKEKLDRKDDADKLHKVIDPNSPEGNLPKTLADLKDDNQKKTGDLIKEGDAAALIAAFDSHDAPIKANFEAGKNAFVKDYENWIKYNKELSEKEASYRDHTKKNEEEKEGAQKEAREAQEKLNKQNAESANRRKSMKQDILDLQYKVAEKQDKVNQVMRELDKTTELEVDGKVIYSNASVNMCTVDIGYEEGASRDLKFSVFVGSSTTKHPIMRGTIKLITIHAHSSEALILPQTPEVVKYSPGSGFSTSDPNLRYDPYIAGGPQDDSPFALEKPKSKKDVVEELRRSRNSQEDELDVPSEQRGEVSTTPPSNVTHDINPIQPGDWIANPEFVRLVPKTEYQREVLADLESLKDVNTGTLTFFFAEVIRVDHRDTLKRLIERNGCKVAPNLSPDVNIILTRADASAIGPLESRLETKGEKKDDKVDNSEVASLKKTLEALKEGRKFGVHPLNEDDLDAFFTRRARKIELIKGNIKQPGQHTFYVVGETKRRSVRETQLYLKEHNGIIADSLNGNIDYVVVGAGLTDAKLDPATGKIYYPGEVAPATAGDFYITVRTMGLKVLREDELDKFLGLK